MINAELLVLVIIISNLLIDFAEISKSDYLKAIFILHSTKEILHGLYDKIENEII